MKTKKPDMVNEVLEMQESMSELTVDKISETAPKVEISEGLLSLKEKARREGAIWLEPKKKFPPIGKLKPEWEKTHAYDWEYVSGIFQGESNYGKSSMESECFWFCKWPGDPDCFWEVPANKKVYLPRMLALYLSGEKDPVTGLEAMKYHTFDYIQRPEPYWKTDDFTHQFQVTGTHYRGRFMPIGVFS